MMALDQNWKKIATSSPMSAQQELYTEIESNPACSCNPVTRFRRWRLKKRCDLKKSTSKLKKQREDRPDCGTIKSRKRTEGGTMAKALLPENKYLAGG